MDGEKLYYELKQAYTDENLNRITAKIIQIYKSGFHSALRDMQAILSDYFTFKDKRIQKCYAKLMMIYHPDKGAQYRNQIEEWYQEGNFNDMHQLSHILHIEKYDEIAISSADADYDIDYDPQYIWDEEAENPSDYGFHNVQNETGGGSTDFNPLYNNFIAVLKRILYGNLSVEIPHAYFEDLEEIEMSDYGLESLEGIELCNHLQYANLSRNCLVNIAELSTLFFMEELILSHNSIGYIDALSCMESLKILDLSHNMVEDISPIMHLQSLEFVDLTNNPIPEEQITELKKKKIAVVY